MAGHRRTLDPHLERALFARVHATRLAAVKGSTLGTIKGAALAVGELLLDGVPGVGAIKAAVELVIGVRNTAKERNGVRGVSSAFAAADITRLEAQRTQDIYERTLDDLALVLEASNDLAKVPAVVFCDDAQFARDGGDEGALRFLKQLWERAEKGQWPLLLVATHWEVDWEQDRESRNGSFGQTFRSIADDAKLSTVVSLPKAESALSALILEGLPGLPPKDVDLLLHKADGNPQVLIELVDRLRTARGWRNNERSLTDYARKTIKGMNCKLTDLIADRLNDPTKTSDEVRVAVALSSLQGMQFLTTLTEATADALKCGKAGGGLSKAANPLRLIVGLDAGVASFVQRAYRDAAESLVGEVSGDEPEKAKAEVLKAALAIIDDPERWATLDANEERAADKQRAFLGVMTSLADGSPDPAVQLRVGRALIQLVALATDNAQRAEYAKQFHAGLASKKWPVDAFTFSELDSVRYALGEWYGYGTTAELCEFILEVTRARQSGSVDDEADLQAALLAASSAYFDRGDYRKAFVLRKEWVEPLRHRADSDPTPENIEAICDALQELRWIAHMLSEDAYAGEEAAVLRDIVEIRTGHWNLEASASAREALISALDDVLPRTPLEEVIERREEIVRLRRVIVAECADDQAGDAQLELASALESLAGSLHKAGQQDAAAEAWSQSLKLLRDLWKRSPTEQRAAEQLVSALKAAAERACGDLAGQRALLLEAVDVLEAIKRLVEASDHYDGMRRHHLSHHQRRHELRYELHYELQSALARNAAASCDWDIAGQHCLQAARFNCWHDVAELSQEIQSQSPPGVNWPSIDKLKAANSALLQAQNPALDDLRQQLQTAPDEWGIRHELASALSERVAELVCAGFLDNAETMALECDEIGRTGNEESRPGHRYQNTVRCFQTLCEGFRTERRFDKALQFAKKVVEWRRADLATGEKDGLEVAEALGIASEIAEAAGQRPLALQFADRSLAITKLVVENDRDSNRVEALLKPLERRAQLAKLKTDWETHDELQREYLAIAEQLWETDGLSFIELLAAQIKLLDNACCRGNNIDAEKFAASVVDTVRKTRERAANFVPYPTLIKQLAAAVQHVTSIDSQAIQEKLKAELAETARELLSKGFKNAERMEMLAARLGEAGLDDEAEQFRRAALAIRERKLDAKIPEL
jgi:hypothetical protein